MHANVENIGSAAVVHLTADQLEIDNVDAFKQAMTPIIRENKQVVLDMGRFQFVDSAGCGAIISCLKQLREAGGDLKLCRVNDYVRTVFDVIRLHHLCEILDSKEEAVQAFMTG
ncbi:MAG: STAS domain-containing protein [Planctomycetales bacterium]